MASYRHIARIAVMRSIFANEFRPKVDAVAMLQYCSSEFKSRLTDLEFAETLLKTVTQHKDEIFDIIQKEAPEWPIERIAPLDRAILEIGIAEIMWSGDVPPVVAINEAVEIAKGFGDLNSPKFVNGVLSTVMHKYKKTEDAKTLRKT